MGVPSDSAKQYALDFTLIWEEGEAIIAFYMPEAGQVLLGVAGDLILDSDKLTDRCCKAGGRPVFAGSSLPARAEGIRCQQCNSQLALIVQVLHLDCFVESLMRHILLNQLE